MIRIDEAECYKWDQLRHIEKVCKLHPQQQRAVNIVKDQKLIQKLDLLIVVVQTRWLMTKIYSNNSIKLVL